ncbi:MAG: DUF1573 domain-containing protein [Prevotella sp.]|nr:DUF1573 domain-containing protein [Prevotella sp.]
MMKQLSIIFFSLLSLGNPASAQSLKAVNEVIDCGQVTFRRPVSIDYEVKNTSGGPLTITNVRTSCGCTTVSYPQTVIPAGGSATVTVSYDAKQLGHFDKQIALYTSSAGEALMLTLKGIVVTKVIDYAGDYPYKLGDIAADKIDLEFDDISQGERPQQKIHIMNTTSKAIQPVVMHLPNYLKADVSPSKLAPGQSGVVTIMLDSRSLTQFGLTQTGVYLGRNPGDKVAQNKEINISAVLLPAFRNMTEKEYELAPKLHVSETTLNLGAPGKKKKLKGDIFIMNEGKTTLEITSLQMFTGGVEVSLPTTQLAPGEVVKLHVVGNVKQLRAARSKPRVLMITNDPKRPKVVIDIEMEK